MIWDRDPGRAFLPGSCETCRGESLMLALRAMSRQRMVSLLPVLILVFLTACAPAAESNEMRILLVADGRQRAYIYDQQISVGAFLEQAGITLGELDRIVPPSNTQLRDGITVTVVRVSEQIVCEQSPIPYQKRSIPNEGLAPGEERLAQSGVNGVEEVCYRITFEDGQETQRVEIQRVVVEVPQDEIVFVGLDTSQLEAVPVEGTLMYVSNGNVWMIRGSSATKRPLTSSGQVDGRVFSLSPDGSQLLFTQRYTDTEGADLYFNTLWTVLDTRASEPRLEEIDLLHNILYAEWVPGQPYTFSYSTAEARSAAPGWQAYNDLWIMRVADDEAVPIRVENLVESSSGGVYGWWGTTYSWASDGSALAWTRADGVGLVDLETGAFTTLLDFPVYTTFQDWVWQPAISWSPDNLMVATTVHGPPFGAEQPENSPIFNVAVTTVSQEESGFRADIVERAGIWASPQFSPFLEGESEFPQAYLAYLQARNPLNSVNDQYNLVVADRDGSNARVLFPAPGEPGLDAQEIVWSPSGRQIAFIYLGNLWIVDVKSGRAQQITIDGGASLPQWAS